jgi:hypothetical protein
MRVTNTALHVSLYRVIDAWPPCMCTPLHDAATDDASKRSAVNVSCEATTTLKRGQAPARSSAVDSGTPQVLALKLLRLQGRPSLVMLAKTMATFEAR